MKICIYQIKKVLNESKRIGCINRDENAVNNMIKIVNTYLLNKTRPLRFCRNVKLDENNNFHQPEKFRRDYKFPEKIKDDNLIIISINNSVKCH